MLRFEQLFDAILVLKRFLMSHALNCVYIKLKQSTR